MANLIALLSILCSFFRSVFGAKNIPPDHKSISISLKKFVNVITFLYPDSKTVYYLKKKKKIQSFSGFIY